MAKSIKKAQLGNLVKAAGKAARKTSNNSVKRITVASNKPSPGKYMNQFAEFSDNFIGKKPSAGKMKEAISYDYTGKKTKYKKGGSFPDLNKDGKITKADILKGRGVIKNGGKLKKAMNGTTTPSMRASRARVASERAEAPMRRSARAAAAATRTSMKNGGKKAPKKMMGGGRCKYGC